MRRSNLFLVFLFFIILFSLVSFASAKLSLPKSMERIKQFNRTYFSEFSVKVSFIVAFLAGILGILSPCILPLLPAYFSYTFKEKKNITIMTFIFFLGFSIMFVFLGVLAGILGEQTLNMIQTKTLVRIASLFIFMFGLLSFFGKSFTLITLKKETKNDVLGVFLFGVLFAISWTGCLGPVLSGILSIGAILGNYVQSGMLLFFYALGNFLPLLALSVFYDKLDMKRFVKGKEVNLRFFGKEIKINSINSLSGILLMASSVFLFIYGGTRLFNSIDPFSTKMLFYEYQNKILEWQSKNVFLFKAIGAVVLAAVFSAMIVFFAKKNYFKPKKTHKP